MLHLSGIFFMPSLTSHKKIERITRNENKEVFKDRQMLIRCALILKIQENEIK